MTDIVVGVRLRADGSGFVGQVRLSKKELEGFADSAQDATRKTKLLNGASGQLTSGLSGLKGAIAGLGLTILARDIIRTASQFEQLRIRLETVTGSAEAAALAFDRIKDFARTTPFEVENLVAAFTRLRAAGITPTTELMQSFGNTASAFGRDITDFADAVIGAITGETERLKAFGIIARVEGDRMRLIFRGNTREINRDSDSIVAALTEIGATDFAGGMERQANSLAGAFSNLQDATSELFDTIGRAGANDVLTEFIRGATEAVELGRQVIDPTLEERLQRANDQIKDFSQRLRDLGDDEPFSFLGFGFSSRAEIEEAVNRALAERSDLLRQLDIQRKREDAVQIAQAEAQAIEAANRARDEELRKLRERERIAGEANRKIETEIAQLARLAEAYDRGTAAIAAANTETEVETALAKAGIEAHSELGRVLADNVRERERLKAVIEAKDEAAERENERQEEAGGLTESLRTAQEELTAELARYKEFLEDGLISQETYNRAVADAQRRYREATDESGLLASAIDGALDGALNGSIRSWQDLGRVAISVLKDIAQQLFETARASESLGGGGGGFLSALFSDIFGSPGPAPAAAPAGGGGGSTTAAALHGGGIAGRDASFRRSVPRAAFAGARRFAGGGFASDEVPAILHRHEGVFTPRQMENADRLFAAALAPPLLNVVINNNSGAEVSVQEGRNARGQASLEVTIDQALARQMNDGRSRTSRALSRRGADLPLREG